METLTDDSGGNPGSFRQHNFTLHGGDWIYVVDLNDSYVVDPAELGGIASISYSLDVFAERDDGQGNNPAMLVLQQDGRFYFSGDAFASVAVNDPWTSFRFTALESHNFDNDPSNWFFDITTSAPDFSTSGSEITIGYAMLAGVNVNGGIFEGTDGVDNFSVDIFTKPKILIGDVNDDAEINILDVAPFVEILSSSSYSEAADINGDGGVNLLDVSLFVELLN